MIKNIQEEWSNGYDSLTILESTAKNKEEQINKNSYLKYCYDSFKNQEGALVTLGVTAPNKAARVCAINLGCFSICFLIFSLSM